MSSTNTPDDMVFRFIRQAAQDGPATVTDRELAEMVSGNTDDASVAAVREALQRLAGSGQIDLETDRNGALAAIYPRPIHGEPT